MDHARRRRGRTALVRLLSVVAALALVAIGGPHGTPAPTGGQPAVAEGQGWVGTHSTVAPDYRPSGPAVYGPVEVVGTIVGGVTARSAIYDPADGDVYVDNSSGSTELVVRGTTLIGQVTIGGAPFGGAFDPVDGDVYIPNQASDNVSILNGTAVVGTIATGLTADAAVYDPVNEYIYVTNSGADTVSVLNGTTLLTNVSVGNGPWAAAVNPKTGWVYVVNGDGSNLTVINGTAVVGSVPVPGNEYGAGFDPSSQTIDTPNYAVNNLSEVRGTTLVAAPATGLEPMGLAYNPADGDMFVTNNGDNSVTVLNGATLVATIPIPTKGPENLVADSLDGLVYVGGGGGGSVVSVVNATALVAQVPVGSFSNYLAFDQADGYVYVVNSYSNNISVLGDSPRYSTTFSEAGLPNDTAWNVTYASQVGSSSSSTITFQGQLPGTYAFTVGAPRGYLASTNLSSPLTTKGNTSVSVYFVPLGPTTYPVWFNETGSLPPGASWSVNTTPVWTSSRVSSSSILFRVPNGSYGYRASGPGYYPAVPGSGDVKVDGRSQEITLRFEEVFDVNFTESGLPPSVAWSVQLSGNQSSIIYDPGTDTESPNSTLVSHAGVTIDFRSAPGSYTYVAASPGFRAEAGTVTVSASGALVTQITFGSSGQGSILSSPWFLLGAGTAGVIAVVVGFLVLRRRGQPRRK